MRNKKNKVGGYLAVLAYLKRKVTIEMQTKVTAFELLQFLN